MAPLLAKLFGGFFVVDLRLLLFLIILAVLLAAGTVLAVRGLTLGRELIPPLVGAFFAFILLLVLITDLVVGYPVLALRSWFEIVP